MIRRIFRVNHVFQDISVSYYLMDNMFKTRYDKKIHVPFLSEPGISAPGEGVRMLERKVSFVRPVIRRWRHLLYNFPENAPLPEYR